MDLRDPGRAGHRRGAGLVRGLLVALSLLALAPSRPARAQAGPAAAASEDLFELILAAFSDDPAPSEALLRHAHERLVQTWVLSPEALPPGIDVHQAARELHLRREVLGFPAAPFLALDLEAAWELTNRGRYQEGADYLAPLFEHYTEPSAELVFLRVFQAGFLRLLERYDAGLAALDEAERVLAELPDTEDPARAREAELRLAAERAYAWLDRGLPDLAARSVLRARELALAAWRAGGADALALFHEGLLVRLAQLLGVDRQEEVVELVASPEVRACLEDERFPAKRRRVRLREAMALANLEHADRARPRRALELLRQLGQEVEAQGASGDALSELAKLWSWTTLCALEEGAWDEAEAALERCARIGAEAPRSRATVAALRARLALLRGDPPEELRAARDACAAAFESLVAYWTARPPLVTGEGYLLLEVFNDLVSESIALALALDDEGRGAEQALALLLRLQGCQSLAKALGAPPVGSREALEGLPADGGALVFHTGWRGSVVLAAERDGVRAFELPPYVTLARGRERLLQALEGAQFGSDPRFGPAQVDARRGALATLCFPAELRERLARWRRCTLVGTDSLGYLPFELLPWDGDETFGERFAVDYLPSFPVGAALASRSAVPATDDAGAAQDAPLTALVPFPATAADGSLAFGAHERSLLLATADAPTLDLRVVAGPEAELSTLAGPARAWLIVGHGERDERSPRPQGIRLADGVLTPSAAEGLRAPELVALVACNAWRGPWRRGDDGRGHLVGSLFLAGARVELASHMRLDYHCGLALLGWILEGLEDGAPLAEAARRARGRARGVLGAPELWSASLLHVVGLGSTRLDGRR